MINPKILEQKQREDFIEVVCLNTPLPKKGDRFTKVFFSSPSSSVEEKMKECGQPIVCLGNFGDFSLLFRIEDGSYYFVLSGKIGFIDETLFAYNPELKYDFGHPVKESDLAEEVSKRVRGGGPFGYAYKKAILYGILDTLGIERI